MADKPDHKGKTDAVDILISRMYHDSENNREVRVLFGTRKNDYGETIGVIETRDANTGDFIKDNSNMDYATFGSFVVGNYYFSPYSSQNNDYNDCLAIEYIGRTDS